MFTRSIKFNVFHCKHVKRVQMFEKGNSLNRKESTLKMLL